MLEKTLRDFYTERLSGYIEILRRMVSINSFTANQTGVNQLGSLTTQIFEHLGFQAETKQSQNPEYGMHLVLMHKGSSKKKVGLITHLDTVFPPEEEIEKNFSWRNEGDRIYGPGTIDIKGGTLMILMVLEALYWLSPKVFNEVSWIVLANAAEERWSDDFGTLCRQHLGSDALAALVFEAGYLEKKQLSLVTARKGMAIFDIRVEGKSAHAGNNHQSGANALIQIADIIRKINDLTDYEQDLTFNIGVLTGGTVPNRVPHYAEARGEMRTFSKEIYDQAVDNLLELRDLPPLKSWDGNFACNVDIQIVLENKPWPTNHSTEALFKIWEEAAHGIGMDITKEERGGLSDGNQLWDYIPTIDGLGPNGRNAHCSERTPDGAKDQEYITISSLIPKAILNTLAIYRLITDE